MSSPVCWLTMTPTRIRRAASAGAVVAAVAEGVAAAAAVVVVVVAVVVVVVAAAARASDVPRGAGQRARTSNEVTASNVQGMSFICSLVDARSLAGLGRTGKGWTGKGVTTH